MLFGRRRSRRRSRRSRRRAGRPKRSASRRRSRRSRRRSRRSRRRSSKVGRPRDMNKHKAERGCSRQTTKKYRSRPGPPFPANLCRGKEMEGNDGKLYVSKRAKNQGRAYYKWVKI